MSIEINKDLESTLVDLSRGPSVDESYEGYAIRYNEMLKLAKTSQELQYICEYKISELIGFYEISCEDIYNILKLLTQDNIQFQEDIINATGLYKNYIILIYEILSQHDVIDYGVSLRTAWIEPLGLELLNPELTPLWYNVINNRTNKK